MPSERKPDLSLFVDILKTLENINAPYMIIGAFAGTVYGINSFMAGYQKRRKKRSEQRQMIVRLPGIYHSIEIKIFERPKCHLLKTNI